MPDKIDPTHIIYRGAEEIGRRYGTSEGEAFYHLARGHWPSIREGRGYITTEAQVQKHLSGEPA